MKNILYKSIATCAILVGSISCGDDILDINTSPNNPATSTAQLTLPAGQVGIASRLGFDYNLLGGMLAHHWTQGPTASQYSFIDQYIFTNNSFSGAWTTMYATALKDLEFVRAYAIDAGDTNSAAIAQLLMCYSYQILVDLYDQVPYSEALKGKEGVLTPKYDAGDEIYDDLIVKIDESLELINLSGSTPSSDLVYGGDMTLWVKFANTLKLKIYMRQVEARPTVASGGIAALEADGAEFIGVGETAQINFSSTTQNENPLWQNLNQTTFQNLVASATSVNFLLSAADPRIDYFYAIGGNNSAHVGLTQGTGVTSGQQYPDFSSLSPQNVDGQAVGGALPVIFLSDVESLFLQAEAAQRGLSTADDESLYNQAVSTSFSTMGYDATAYIGTSGGYEYDGTLEQLITQKWVAFNGTQGFEAWCDWRRTGFPSLDESVTSTLGAGQFPLRIVWPITEEDNNPNAPTSVPITTPVWWDVD